VNEEQKVAMGSNEGAMLQLLTLLVQELKGTVNNRIDQIIDKIENYHEENKALNDKVQKLANEVAKHTQEIAQLKNEAQTKPQTQSLHTVSAPENRTPARPLPERGIRRNNLIITGLEADQADPRIVIENFIQTHFPTATQGILAVQSLSTRGRNDTTINRGQQQSIATIAPPRFLVTFRSVWDAQNVYNERLRKLRDLNIFISEDLSPAEASIFYKARQLKKSNVVVSTWTKDGRTFVRKEIGQEPIEIHNEHPLLKIPMPTEQTNQTTHILQPQLKATSPEFHPNSTSTISSPSLSSSSAEIKDSSDPPHLSPQITKSSEPLEQATSLPPTSEKDLTDECMTLIQGAITRANQKRRKRQDEEAKNIGLQ